MAAPRPDRTEPGAGRRASALTLRLAGAALTAGAVSVGYQYAYRRIDFPLPSQVPTVVASLVAIAVVACAAAAVLVHRGGVRARGTARHSGSAHGSGVSRRSVGPFGPGRTRTALLTACGWALPALLSTAVQCRLLTGTRFYTNGLGGDQQFRTAFLTRMTDSSDLADAIYPGLPPYYSPAWFWVGGRLADASGIPGWEFYKIWAITTLAVSAALAYVLWTRIVGRRVALVTAIITALIGLHAGAYSPYSWILIAVAPPLAVLAWRTARRIARDGRREWGGCVGIGVYVGLASITHAVFAAVAAVYLVVVVIAAVWHFRRDTRVGHLAAGACVAVVSALPFAAVVWVPYLLAPAPLGTDSTAAKFLPDIGAHVPTPVFDATVIGVLAAAGLAWMLVRIRRSPVAAALCALVATALGWYVLSFLATAFSTTLLAFRLGPLMLLALTCAGALGVRDAAILLRAGGRRPGPRDRARERAKAVTAVVSAFAVLGALHAAYQAGTLHPDWDAAAQNTAGPDGIIARGTELQRIQPGASADDIREAIEAETGGRPAADLVLLSNVHNLFAFFPYRGFQAVTSAYANPKAGFAARSDLIRSWSAAGDGGELARMLASSPVRPPDVFVLRRAPEGWIYDLPVSQLPREPGDTIEPVVFDPALFDSDHFTTRRLGSVAVVAVRR